MELVTIDFETYYDGVYSLSKMSTEDYVCDPRFEIIGVGIKRGNSRAVWHPTHQGALDALREIDWQNSAMLAHHTMFDGLICAAHAGIHPRMYLDTKSMANAALKPFTNSASLAKVSSYLRLGEKGREVISAMGKRITDFQADELFNYGRYCCNDTELCYAIFKRMMETFPKDELHVIDRTLRMYLQPSIELDVPLLEQHLEALRQRKDDLLNNLPDGATPEALMSNPQLAELLRKFGVEPPMKVSPTTGLPSLAMAKTDPEFVALAEHEDENVQAIMAARLGTKSTIAETRTEKLLEIGRRYGKLRIPLVYYGAHTGRWSGCEGINVQNLPKKGELRRALVAPAGHSLVVADFKQIEARVLAWAAKEPKLLDDFLAGRDVYTAFAAVLFDKFVEDITPAERFIGKTCVLGLGYGMGWEKFQTTLATKGIVWAENQVKRTVVTYRSHYGNVPAFWSMLNIALGDIARRTTIEENWRGLPITVGPQCLLLPNGMPLMYNNLQVDQDRQWVYRAGNKWKKLYGAKVCENWDQGVSRIIMTDAEQRISYPMVLTVHDELVFLVPDAEIDFAIAQIETEMVKQPEWAVPFGPIPLAVEISAAKRYGDAKE